MYNKTIIIIEKDGNKKRAVLINNQPATSQRQGKNVGANWLKRNPSYLHWIALPQLPECRVVNKKATVCKRCRD